LSSAVISSSVTIGTGFSGGAGISMPSVGATSSSPSVTGHRQNRRIPRSRVPTVEGSAVSVSHAATARRVSSSSTGCRPRSVSRRVIV
jgi:hypothetical protein